MTRETANGKFQGFTLGELLIALLILGVIATFTIPKVLQSQASSRSKAVAKETAAALSEAFTLYRNKNTLSASTRPADLTPYLNFVKLDTTSALVVDAAPCDGQVTYSCNSTYPCAVLHNGAILNWIQTDNFNGTATTNMIGFYLDPDGKVSNNKDTLLLELYYNGKLRTRNTIDTGSVSYYDGSVQTLNPSTTCDPTWFSWN